MVEGDGFEPPKAQLTDLQSAPFGHSGIPRELCLDIITYFVIMSSSFYWSWWRESNPQPADYKSAALPLSHTSIWSCHRFKKEMVPRLGIEPRTQGFSVPCSTYWAIWANTRKSVMKKNGRGGRIWTRGPLVPNQLRYQTALHPDI